MDVDQDKVVSKKEFFSGMRKLGIDANTLPALWSFTDPLKRGFLTYDKFVSLLKADEQAQTQEADINEEERVVHVEGPPSHQDRGGLEVQRQALVQQAEAA